jgi:hypothetical protein
MSFKRCVTCGCIITTLGAETLAGQTWAEPAGCIRADKCEHHEMPHAPGSGEVPPLPDYNGKIQITVTTSSAVYAPSDLSSLHNFFRK